MDNNQANLFQTSDIRLTPICTVHPVISQKHTDPRVDVPKHTIPCILPPTENSILKMLLEERKGTQHHPVHMRESLPSCGARQAMGVRIPEGVQPGHEDVYAANYQQHEMAYSKDYYQPAYPNNNGCDCVPLPGPQNVTCQQEVTKQDSLPYAWMKTSVKGDTGSVHKRTRQAYSSEQTCKLEQHYRLNNYVDKKRRHEIAISTKLNEKQVKVWFQNRRMKDKKLKGTKCETLAHNVSPVNGLYGPKAPFTTSAGIPMHPNAALPVTSGGVAHPCVAASCRYYPEQQQQQQQHQEQLQQDHLQQQQYQQYQYQHLYQLQQQQLPCKLQVPVQQPLEQDHLQQHQQQYLYKEKSFIYDYEAL